MGPISLHGVRAIGLLGVVLVAMLGASAHTRAQSARAAYPRNVVMLTTHSSPGGGSDVFLREMAPHLARVLGTKVVVDNLAGGSGARAMAALSKAKPDGGMFYATTPTFIYTSLLSRPAATYRDLEPLVNIFYDPEVLYTAANSRFKTLEQVIDHARTGKGRWGAANPASLERQVMERLKQRAKVTPAIATFEGGGDMLINVLNGTLDMGIGELQEIRGQLDSGRLRLLAVAGDARLTQFPDVRTVREHGLDVSVRKFRGLAGPKGLPPAVVAAWDAAIPKLLADPAYQKIYTKNSLLPGFIPHADYGKFMNGFGQQAEGFLKESGVIR
jgi:tripartite-type tricarboxylate transporter receptor subunit TctC